jgi:hypothetical protein
LWWEIGSRALPTISDRRMFGRFDCRIECRPAAPLILVSTYYSVAGFQLERFKTDQANLRLSPAAG